MTPFHRNFLFLVVSLFVFIASSFPCRRLTLPTSGRSCETRHTDRRLILPVIGLCAFSDLDFGQYCSPRKSSGTSLSPVVSYTTYLCHFWPLVPKICILVIPLPRCFGWPFQATLGAKSSLLRQGKGIQEEDLVLY